MNRKITALCIALVALSGCSASEQQEDTSAVRDLSTSSEALFGESDGLPYGSGSVRLTRTDAGVTETTSMFGRQVISGDFDGDGYTDLAASDMDDSYHGRVYVFPSENINVSEGKGTGISLELNDTEGENLGASLATVKCPAISDNDLIIASAPMYSWPDPENKPYSGAFALLGVQDNALSVKKFLKVPDGMQVAGGKIAVDDINGDGKPDLVYQSRPIDSSYSYLNPKVSVALDICQKFNGETLTADASVTGPNVTVFGEEIYIKDLNGKNHPEIIVVDPSHDDGAEGSSNGAVYFYEFTAGKLQQTRDPIIGIKSDKGGESIQSVAFSDIDSDGDLDLIVGGPMYQDTKKREGRVRTYTNKGEKISFDASDIKWSYVGGRGNGKFGYHVAVADVNGDKVNDLIVGAQGYDDGSGTSVGKGNAGIYLFVGTKDGKTFSTEPFWNHISFHSEANNGIDAFSTAFVVADLDHKGWLDLAVGAPTSNTKGDIEIFYESAGFCFNANGCFIDNTCVEANTASPNSKCKICDPSVNAFDYSVLTCEGTETACQEAATCDDLKGCIAPNKEDGEICAQTTCTSNNLTVSTCKSGKCEATSTACGDYVCNAKLSSCPTTCKKDSACANGKSCIDGQCSFSIPVIVMPKDVTVVQGKSKTLTATVTASSGDVLTYDWDCGELAINPHDASVTVITEPDTKAGKYTCTLTVTNSDNQVVSGNVTVKVNAVSVTILTPEMNSIMTAPTITFSGKSSGTGSVNVINQVNQQKICTGKISSGVWNCKADLEPGDYTVFAEWSKNAAQKSKDRTFKVVSAEPDNNPPNIVIEDIFTGKAGETITLDASKSNDPDNDKITFKWTESETALLSDTSSSTPTFTIPDSAVPGDTYSFILTVTDEKDASVSKTVVVTVKDIDHSIQITSPVQSGTIYVAKDGSFAISGTTDIEEGEIVVTDANEGTLCKAIIKDSLWECQTTAVESHYDVVASWTDGENSVLSGNVAFDVVFNEPPVIDVADGYIVKPGETLSLDACNSYDPEGQPLSFKWTVDDEVVSDGMICNPSFKIPETATDGTQFHFVVTASDGVVITSAEGIIRVSADFDITMTKPTDGAISGNPVAFEGMANAGSSVEVRSSATKDIICSTTANENSVWKCEASITPGDYTVQAYIVSNDIDLAMSNKVNFTVAETDNRPVIVSPQNGEKISIRPTVSGTIEATTGAVSIWINYGSYSILMCSSNVSAAGTWSCTASFDLEYSTAYTFEANWKDKGAMSNMSDQVKVVTVSKSEEPEPEKTTVVITVPVDGSELDASKPVIFAGTSDPEAPIDVYIGEEKLACSTIADTNGNWSCNDIDTFSAGSYTAYADDRSDGKIIPSNKVTFKLVENYESEPSDYDNARGGSCSISTQPTGQFGWIFMLAGLAGLGVLRRRRAE